MEIKIKDKKIKIDLLGLLILVIPLLVMILLLPLLPDKIPMQFSLDGSVRWYLDKKFSFLFGLIPYVVYISYRLKHRYR